MFYYLEGIIDIIDSGLIVVDCNGAGYGCSVSANTMAALESGQRKRIYTYCNIKENAFDIYGFAEAGEKHCFELLTTVSGVGPKAAMSILSVCTPEGLAMAVVTEDVATLQKAPGIGKKLAQRVILELRDKVSKETVLSKTSDLGIPPSTVGGKSEEAAAALGVLGYTPGEISALMRKIDIEKMTTEEIVKEALKNSL